MYHSVELWNTVSHQENDGALDLPAFELIGYLHVHEENKVKNKAPPSLFTTFLSF